MRERYETVTDEVRARLDYELAIIDAVGARLTPEARRQLAEVMDVVDANWRGIGVIPKSGYALREAYAAHDARRQFRSYADESRKRVGEMPPGCYCASVVLGKIYPNECRIYGVACTPREPVGPCMVSDEGACRIWWGGGVRTQQAS